MKVTPQQREIRSFLMGKESATLQEIYDGVSFGYYCNGLKHMGSMMSRLVKSGLVVRVKKGVFRLPKQADLPLFELI